MHTAIFKMDTQQGPIILHMELYSVLYARLNGSGVWGRMDTCICMAKSLCCPPETITTLLISYTPIENEKSKKETNPPNILPLYVLLSVSLQGVLSCGQGRLQKSPPVILSGQRQTKTVHLGLVFSCSFP